MEESQSAPFIQQEIYGQASVDKREIIGALKSSCEVFINFFLHESLTFHVPDFHKRIWALMCSFDLQRIALAVPRGHAKTTLAKLVAVWYFLFTPVKFIVYVSNTADAAVSSTKDIMEFILCNNFIQLFGPATIEVGKWGEGEFVFVINTPFHGQKRCILKARGANQQVRGLNIHNQRPEVAIVDDLEDVEDLENEKVRSKTLKWFFGTFYKALDRRVAKIIFIGNLLDNNCLLYKLIHSKHWTSMVLGAILKDGGTLWKDMWPLDKLIEDYQQYCELGLQSLWFAEMMNLIIVGRNALIKPEDIFYLPVTQTDKVRAGYITIDPATGRGGDDTAIVVHLLVEDDAGNQIPQVVDYRFGDFSEDTAVNTTIELCFQWGISVIGIEAVAFQRAYALLFQTLFIMRGLTDLVVVKLYPGHSSKLLRLRAWCAICKSRGYALTQGEMHATHQLLAFNVQREDNRDDLIDSIAMGQQMLQEHYGLILSKVMGTIINIKPVRAHQLC